MSDNEKKALSAICNDCDELDGWGFTRIADMVMAVCAEFGNNAQVAGGYISDFIAKGIIELDEIGNEVWVKPEIYAEYC